MRWTWIDRFVRFESGKSATAVKNLSLAEDHFADHFPGFPVMPATLILEGLAQTGGILVGEANRYEKNVVLAKMNNVKVRRDALAGEQLTYTATVVALNDTGAQVSATATSGDEMVVEADIMFAHVTAAQMPPGLPTTKFVFDGGLKNLLLTAEASKPAAEPKAEPVPAVETAASGAGTPPKTAHGTQPELGVPPDWAGESPPNGPADPTASGPEGEWLPGETAPAQPANETGDPPAAPDTPPNEGTN